MNKRKDEVESTEQKNGTLSAGSVLKRLVSCVCEIIDFSFYTNALQLMGLVVAFSMFLILIHFDFPPIPSGALSGYFGMTIVMKLR